MQTTAATFAFAFGPGVSGSLAGLERVLAVAARDHVIRKYVSLSVGWLETRTDFPLFVFVIV